VPIILRLILCCSDFILICVDFIQQRFDEALERSNAIFLEKKGTSFDVFPGDVQPCVTCQSTKPNVSHCDKWQSLFNKPYSVSVAPRGHTVPGG
jgi:hypothetical protein